MKLCSCPLAGTEMCEICCVSYNNFIPIAWPDWVMENKRYKEQSEPCPTIPTKTNTPPSPKVDILKDVGDKPIVDEKQPEYFYKVTIEKFDEYGNLIEKKVVEE